MIENTNGEDLTTGKYNPIKKKEAERKQRESTQQKKGVASNII